MPHSETEHEDQTLREAGFDPAAPAAEAVARLGQLRGTSGVTDGAVARALGAVPSQESAAMLAEMETGASGAARREIRRALFRLRQRGIAPAVPAAETGAATRGGVAPSADAGLSAIFSPIDSEGGRIIWLVKTRHQGGLARLWGLIADDGGLINASLSNLSRRDLRTERAELERRVGMAMVDGDWRLADFIMCEAYRRTPEVKRGQVGNFLALRAEIIGAPPPAEIVHPIYAEMGPLPDREPSPDLFKEPDAASLRFPTIAINQYVDEIKSAQESVLVINRAQREERVNSVLDRAITELMAGDRAASIRRRLEDTAYYMVRTGRREAAQSVAAAAQRLRDGVDPRRIPFFRVLLRLQLGAVFAEEREKEREEPRLVVTPAEAMRAQEEARGRRR